MNCKEIQPVHPKGNQSWIFIERTDAEAETTILWPADAKNWLIGKDPNAGKDGMQEKKGTTEDEMIGWHHRLDGQESEQALGGVGDGQGSLVCCRPWGCKESNTTVQLNWTEIHSHLLLLATLLCQISLQTLSNLIFPTNQWEREVFLSSVCYMMKLLKPKELNVWGSSVELRIKLWCSCFK